MPKKIRFALILMGFTSLVVQTLLIREFLITFYGNELTIGLVLANWIILEALGSSLLSKASLKIKRPYLVYALLQIGIALYLPLSIFLIRDIKHILGLTLGEGIGILPILFTSFFILAPLSLFDGAQFPFGCRILSDAKAQPLESAGRVYILEAVGFILAGPIFTYLLITKLNSFSIAFILGALNLFSALFLLRKRWLGLLFAFIIIAIFGPATKLHNLSLNKQWPGQKVLNYQNSIYGNLAVTQSKNQYTFYSDGIPIITTPVPDITEIEELAHFSMLSHPYPKNVLLLSGGAGGVIKEILKYPITKLTYTELDPLLIKLVKDFPTELTKDELADHRLELKHIDARRFLYLAKPRAKKYDVIILNLPMPSTLQLNRFYTREFFQNVKSVLAEDGIFSFSLPGSLSYLSPAMRNLNGSILNTLKDVLYVNIIPGDFNLYLAGKHKFNISPEIFLNRLSQEGIKTRLLNKFHLEYRLHPRWLKWFDDSLSDYTKIRKNFDLLPSGTFYSISYWNTIFSPRLEGLFRILDKINYRFLLISLVLLGLGIFIIKTFIFKSRKSPSAITLNDFRSGMGKCFILSCTIKRWSIGFAIGSTGFVGMSLELIFIYAYQSFYGFVFSHLALLVTAFMAGLTLGGWQMTKRLKEIKNGLLTFSKIELALTGFCLIAIVSLLYLNRFPSLKLSFVLFLLVMLSGYLVGLEFPLANKIYSSAKTYTQTAGMLYALDLFGAWGAALVISVALVPVIGIIKTCIFLAGIKAISLILVVSS